MSRLARSASARARSVLAEAERAEQVAHLVLPLPPAERGPDRADTAVRVPDARAGDVPQRLELAERPQRPLLAIACRQRAEPTCPTRAAALRASPANSSISGRLSASSVSRSARPVAGAPRGARAVVQTGTAIAAARSSCASAPASRPIGAKISTGDRRQRSVGISAALISRPRSGGRRSARPWNSVSGAPTRSRPGRSGIHGWWPRATPLRFFTTETARRTAPSPRRSGGGRRFGEITDVEGRASSSRRCRAAPATSWSRRPLVEKGQQLVHADERRLARGNGVEVAVQLSMMTTRAPPRRRRADAVLNSPGEARWARPARR